MALSSQVQFDGHCFPCVEFLQWEYAQLHEEADSVVDYLFWSVGILGNCLYFLTLLNSVEEHFWGFCGWEWTAE